MNKRLGIYGILAVMVLSQLVMALDCTQDMSWQNKVISPDVNKVYIVSSDAVISSMGGSAAVMLNREPTCKARQPTLSELLNFNRYYTYKIVEFKGATFNVQSDKSSHQIQAYDFTDAFADGKGLYIDLLPMKITPLKCSNSNVTFTIEATENTTESNSTKIVTSCY